MDANGKEDVNETGVYNTGGNNKWFKCDGCGVVKVGDFSSISELWYKPKLWYSRKDKDGEQIACSRVCIKIIANATGKTSVVLPW